MKDVDITRERLSQEDKGEHGGCAFNGGGEAGDIGIKPNGDKEEKSFEKPKFGQMVEWRE